MRTFREKIWRKRITPQPVSQVQSPDEDSGLTISESASPQSPPPVLDSVAEGEVTVPFPEGIKEWFASEDPVVDICFVHGLTGNRDSTWTARGQKDPWPKSLLPQEFPNLNMRILTYGYDAYIVRHGHASSNRLIDHAANFLQKLTADREKHEAENRPLILVAHSLGGLVCKKAILDSKSSPEAHLERIYDSLIGVIFLGTPHTGSWWANWGEIPAKVLGIFKSTNLSLLRVLQTEDEALEDLNRRFLYELRKLREGPTDGKRIQVFCFFEELGYTKIGKIVSKESATFAFDTPESIHANHSDMVKFPSITDGGFISVAAHLRRWTKELRRVDADRVVVIERPRVQRLYQSHSLLRESPAQSERKSRLLSLLNFPGINDRHNRIKNPFPGTGSWIFGHECYRQWEQCGRSDKIWLLCITGKPGAGKSTIMKSILQRQARVSQVLTLSFFFSRSGSDYESSALGLYCSFWHEIVMRTPFHDLPLRELDWCLRSNVEPETREVVSRLEALLHDFLLRRVWTAVDIFIDAFDECGEDEDEYRKLVRLFYETGEQANRMGIKLRICWSMRSHPKVSVRRSLEIIVDAENARDIQTYLAYDLEFADSYAATRVGRMILEKASGCFLWAKLVLENFHSYEDRGMNIDNAFNDLPLELNQLYDEIFTRTKTADDRTTTLELASWVLLAGTELTTEGLFIALHFATACSEYHRPSTGQHLAEILSSFDALRFAKYIKHVSGGLIEISQPDQRLCLMHDSVRIYFQKETTMAIFGLKDGLDFDVQGRMRIAKACELFLQIPDLFLPTRPPSDVSISALSKYLTQTYHYAVSVQDCSFVKYVVRFYPLFAERLPPLGSESTTLSRQQIKRDTSISWVVHFTAFALRQSHWDMRPWLLSTYRRVHEFNDFETDYLGVLFKSLEVFHILVLAKFEIKAKHVSLRRPSTYQLCFSPRGKSTSSFFANRFRSEADPRFEDPVAGKHVRRVASLTLSDPHSQEESTKTTRNKQALSPMHVELVTSDTKAHSLARYLKTEPLKSRRPLYHWVLPKCIPGQTDHWLFIARHTFFETTVCSDSTSGNLIEKTIGHFHKSRSGRQPIGIDEEDSWMS